MIGLSYEWRSSVMAEKNFFEVWGKESPETMKLFMDFAGNL